MPIILEVGTLGHILLTDKFQLPDFFGNIRLMRFFISSIFLLIEDERDEEEEPAVGPLFPFFNCGDHGGSSLFSSFKNRRKKKRWRGCHELSRERVCDASSISTLGPLVHIFYLKVKIGTGPESFSFI